MSARAEIEELMDGLFQSMNVQDLNRFTALNAHDRDVVHIGTEREERWVGWEQLEAATIEQFASLESFRVSHRQRVVKVLASGDVACFSQVMDLETTGAGGEHRLEDARLTGVAERRDGRWVLVQTHLSVPES